MSYEFKKPQPQKEMPSAWRGIGCILMVLLPILSYGVADLLLKTVPAVRSFFLGATPWLFGQVPIAPVLLYISSLNFLWNWLASQNDLMITLLVTVIVLIFASGLFSMTYAFMYRTVAPPKYGPQDAPPQKRRGKRKKYNR